MPFKFSPGHCNTGDCGCEPATCIGCPPLGGDIVVNKITVRWVFGVLCFYSFVKAAPCYFVFGASSVDLRVNPPILILDGCTMTFDAAGSYCTGGSNPNILLRWTRGACTPCGSTLATDAVFAPSLYP